MKPGTDAGTRAKRFRLAIINSHPIQYFAPLYRRLSETPDIDLTVYYCSRRGLDGGQIDPGFGQKVHWDVPLLEGYRAKFLRNSGNDEGRGGFWDFLNWEIAGEMLRDRYDAVIIHGHRSATNAIAILAAKCVGTKVFMRGETHLGLKCGPFKAAVRRPVMTLLYWLCDACLYIGTLNREFYVEHRVPESNLFLVPYAVDNEYFAARSSYFAGRRDEIRTELGIVNGDVVILYASKLIGRKRPMDLLRAFKSLADKGAAASLVLVGDGPARGEIEDFLAAHAIQGVKLVGFKNQSELPKYYAAADIFVLPSENEPWGLVLNEVMCGGVPVVASREVGAARDLVVEGETGTMYETGDWKSLASKLSVLVNDPRMRSELGKGASRKIGGWGYRECVAGIRSALERKVSDE